MKKVILMMIVILAACLSFNDEAKAATKKVNLVNEYTWTSVHRPDVLRLRVIDSNDNNIIREMSWVDTWEDEDTNAQLNSFKLATVLFCDGDVVELTNMSNHESIRQVLNFHEIQMDMLGY